MLNPLRNWRNLPYVVVLMRHAWKDKNFGWTIMVMGDVYVWILEKLKMDDGSEYEEMSYVIWIRTLPWFWELLNHGSFTWTNVKIMEILYEWDIYM